MKNILKAIALSGIVLGCNPRFYDEGFAEKIENTNQEMLEYKIKYKLIPLGKELVDMLTMSESKEVWNDKTYLYNNDEIKKWFDGAKTNSAYRDSLDKLIHKYNNFISKRNDFSFSHTADDFITIVEWNNKLYIDIVYEGAELRSAPDMVKYVEKLNGYDALARYRFNVSNKDLRELISFNENVSKEDVVLKIQSLTLPDKKYYEALEKYERDKIRLKRSGGILPILRKPSGTFAQIIDGRRSYLKNELGQEIKPEWKKGEAKYVPVKTILNIMYYRLDE